MIKILYLEAYVSSRKIGSKNGDGSCLISTELLAIRPPVTCSVVPLNCSPLPPCSLECYIWL